MLTITTTIRLLTNIKLLQVARKQHGAHSKVTVDARRRCVSIAKEVAEHFVQSFEKTARNLSRNVVLMMGWTALVLIKVSMARQCADNNHHHQLLIAHHDASSILSAALCQPTRSHWPLRALQKATTAN